MKNKLYPPEIVMLILVIMLMGSIILSLTSMKTNIDNYQIKTSKQEKIC